MNLFKADNKIIDLTYAQLKALVDNSLLSVGQLYRITDYRTYHLIPNSTNVYHTGTTEPLVVKATGANTLDRQVYSETYPQDIIYYKLVDDSGYDSGVSFDRGVIYYRHDTNINTSAWEDWRNLKYRRWETSLGSGIYTVLNDNGFAYLDRYMFADSQTAGVLTGVACTDTHIGDNYGLPSNNIFGDKSSKNFFGDTFKDNTFGTDCNRNFIGAECDFNVVGNFFTGNVVGHSFSGNTIGINFDIF